MNAVSEPIKKHRLSNLGRVLFYVWNVIFLAFILLGFAPVQLPSLIRMVNNGTTPFIYLVFCLVLIAIPVVSALVGVIFLRKDASRLFALGYVVEWPLMLILFFRFFLIREGNPAITVLLVWLAVAEALFLWHLLDRKIDQRGAFWRYLRLSGLTLLFSGTIYAAVWLAFYVPPIAVGIYEMIKNFFQYWSEIFRHTPAVLWYQIPLSILGWILVTFSGTLIIVMPVAAPVIAGKTWLRSLRNSLGEGKRLVTLASTILPLTVVLIILGVSMAQPQGRAFQLLKTAPETPEQAQDLLRQQEQIRAGLVNAYLASFRYISSLGEVRHISDMYQYTLDLPESVAWQFELAYEVVIRPFLYVPVHTVQENRSDGQNFTNDQQEAAILYQQFFDRPIVKGEREEIVRAVRSSSDGVQAEQAWQAVDDREVHLNLQEVRLTEHGDWAEVEIHEAYENRTFQRQEVVYYFSLPESAVVTGLWLGNSSDRGKAFAYVVAPRGAAQAVYRNEIRYNRDPALVEQIGPRQYRLRAFPLEPQSFALDSDQHEPDPGPELHLWMAYRTMRINGTWPLPSLAEKRNVYWDAKTTRTINGQSISGKDAAWLPGEIQPTAPVVAKPHRVDFPGGQTVLIQPAADVETARMPENLRLAVVLDRSFSMRERASDVKQAITFIRQSVKSGPEPDLFLTASKYRGEAPGRVGLASLDPDEVLYFGGQNAAELLAQFEELQAGKVYDAILVLTDDTGYELSAGDVELQVPDAPVWVVHLGDGFPLGYDDSTQQAIQASGGGVAATIEEALSRFAASRNMPGRLDIVDGYVWQTLPTSDASALAGSLPANLQSATDEEAGFAALAARRVILAEMPKNHGKLDQVSTLDQLHALAIKHSIVTPYSSMLVLVNDAQQELLRKLSEQQDRYRRETEGVGETTQANPFMVSGVPEPEEWLLLALAVLLLAFAGWRNRIRRPARPV